MTVTIRELDPRTDMPFLWKMLDTALFWRGGWKRIPAFIVLRIPPVRIYHEKWGRPGDLGLIAEVDGIRAGAVWCRLFTDKVHGEGYIDAETPELAIGVEERYRGRGIGRQLMEALHERARRNGVRRMGLSVETKNPAKRLYSSLGYVPYQSDDKLGRMVLDLADTDRQ